MLHRLLSFTLLVIAIGFIARPSSSHKKTATPAPPVAQTQPRDYPVKPVPFTSVHFTDKFWAPRLEITEG